MDAQPNIGNLTEAFTTSSKALAVVSQEIAHVANLPAFNNGQHILEAIERLTTSINTLTTDMNSKFDSLNLRLGAESAYFSPFSIFIIIIFYSSLNHTARVYNSRISSRDTPLRALHDQYNRAVAEFPRDSASLMRLPGQIKSQIEKLSHQTNIMTGNTLTTLLDAFQLPADGTVEVKQRRFREFVGLVVDA